MHQNVKYPGIVYFRTVAQKAVKILGKKLLPLFVDGVISSVGRTLHCGCRGQHPHSIIPRTINTDVQCYLITRHSVES